MVCNVCGKGMNRLASYKENTKWRKDERIEQEASGKIKEEKRQRGRIRFHKIWMGNSNKMYEHAIRLF